MAYYPQSATGLNYITYPIGPTAGGLDVATSASANTKGSYVQAVASSGFTCNAAILAVMRQTASVLRAGLIDLAIGAAASEVVKIANVSLQSNSSTTSHLAGGTWYFPWAVPSSTRIALRAQASTGSTDIFLALTLIASGGVGGISSLDTYGAATGTSTGTSVDPGGSGNTKGSYAEIASSTSAIAQFLNASITRGPSASSATAAQWSLDLATGGAGSETVLIPDLRTSSAAASNGPNLRSYNLTTYIAASTRIAARASCDITTSGDRLLGVAIYTGTAPTEPSGSAGGAWAFA